MTLYTQSQPQKQILTEENARLRKEIAALQERLRIVQLREQHYRKLAEQNCDILSVHDSDSRVDYVTPAGADLLGYRPEELIGQNALQFVHPDDRIEIEAKGIPPKNLTEYTTRYRIRHKDGHFIAVETKTLVMFDSKGMPDELVCRTNALPHETQPEQKSFDRRIGALLNALPDKLAILDAQTGRYLYLNTAFQQMLGYTHADYTAWQALPAAERDLRLLHPAESALHLECQQRLEALQEGEVYETQYQVRHLHDAWKQVQHHFTMLNFTMLNRATDDSPAYILDVAQELAPHPPVDEIQDTTGFHSAGLPHNQQTEAWLKQSQTRLLSIIEHLPIMVLAFDAEGKILAWNGGAVAISGFQAEEVIGKMTTSEILLVEVETRKQWCVKWQETGGDLRNIHMRFPTKFGDRRDILWTTLSPRFPIEGWPHWGVAIDITEQQRVEHELRKSRDELEHRVQERTSDLTAFAHSTAHDLKAPLATTKGYVDLLLGKYGSVGVEESKIFLREIETSIDDMITLINAMLLFATLDHSEVPLTCLNMGLVLRNVLKRLEFQIRDSDATLETPDMWPNVVSYAPWIEEVWTNYLTNAIKYGGTPPYLRFGADTLGDGRCRFWIHDNGQGIPEDKLKQLFKPFTRMDLSHKDGHGLGLSIVQHMIEKLGGQVGVESTPGEGSTFYFILPIQS
jgi:PAS domain S-box-containing protein